MLRASPSPRRVDAWALALSSKGVPSLLRQGEDGYELHVMAGDAARARAELDAADAEEAEQASRAEVAERRPVGTYAWVGSSALSLLLLAFFGLTGPRASGALWFTAGASEAQRVLHGEWWRTVTALTLHADGAHALSNVAIGTFVVGAVMRSEGVGLGAALVLAAGTAGNLINAWVHQALHSSVGFSTAVFGAIGILGGLAFMRPIRGRAWTALAGVLALLALLGTSEKGNVDMLAHVFGALAGVGLGLLSARLPPVTTVGQVLAGTATAALIVGAWLRALA